jgi:hypothetical protein
MNFKTPVIRFSWQCYFCHLEKKREPKIFWFEKLAVQKKAPYRSHYFAGTFPQNYLVIKQNIKPSIMDLN